jgi:hypothetical protein
VALFGMVSFARELMILCELILREPAGYQVCGLFRF